MRFASNVNQVRIALKTKNQKRRQSLQRRTQPSQNAKKREPLRTTMSHFN
jgi:hypothetical protein